MRIFVCGLSKSGKTTLSRYASHIMENVEIIRLSQILREAHAELPVPTLKDGIENQAIVAAALAKYRAKKQHQLIDGHALIETMEGPLLIPDWFYDRTLPDAIVYLNENPKVLAERRNMAGSPSDLKALRSLNAIELAACERVAVRLEMGLCHLVSPTRDQFVEAIYTLISIKD